MRITFTARAAAPVRGGIQSYLRLVAAGLAEAGHTVSVLTTEGVTREGLSNGQRLLAGAGFEPFDRWGYTTAPLTATGHRRALAGASAALDVAAERVARLRPAARVPYIRALAPEIVARADAPDLLHCMNGGDFCAATLRAARGLGVPFVVTPHAHRGQWDDAPADGRAYRQADAVIAVSDADAAVYVALGVAPEKVRVIRPCTEPPPAAGYGGVPGDGPTLLFLGRRDAYKGVNLLLDALPSIRAAHPTARLVVAGPGELPSGAAQEGVIDAGIVSDEGKYDLLRSADLLCLPSAFESFGLVVAEAWSVGTPVLTSETPALAELVRAGAGGVTAPRDSDAIAAAVIDVLADPDRLRAYGAAGGDYWRAELAPDRTIGRLTALYAELLGG